MKEKKKIRMESNEKKSEKQKRKSIKPKSRVL